MPYDDLARIRAEMLMQQDQGAYDDGAYMLGQSPYMQPVGLFGKGKPKPVAPPIDIQRRSILGLKPQEPAPANLPAVRSSDVPVPSAVPQPQAPAIPAPTQPTAAPLTELANKILNEPVSRRTVLQRAGSAALQHALPTPKAADIVKEVASPLVESAVHAVPEATGVAPGITLALKKLLSSFIKQSDYDEDELKHLESHLSPDTSGDKVLNALSGLTNFYDFLNDQGMVSLLKDFRKQGASKDDVIDFLDTYFEGFDVDDDETIDLIDSVYKKTRKSKKGE